MLKRIFASGWTFQNVPAKPRLNRKAVETTCHQLLAVSSLAKRLVARINSGPVLISQGGFR
jgi:hypothetical protein